MIICFNRKWSKPTQTQVIRGVGATNLWIGSLSNPGQTFKDEWASHSILIGCGMYVS
jgi:hypothetical protein